MMNKNKENRTGEVFVSTVGEHFKIIEYFNCNNCTIQFEDGSILYNQMYKSIKIGHVFNPYFKTYYNIGFLGEGVYNTRKDIKVYNTWSNMLKRCYSQTEQEKHPTYKEVTVCEEWHNFQNFAEWFYKNYVEGWQLDKDILVKGNKIYSPETCAFVPREINNLFLFRRNSRGKYPIGVKAPKRENDFEVGISKNSKIIYLGTFNTPEEAFQAYKVAKEQYIKEVADKWRDQITEEVYRALINYQVEITD